MSLLLRRRNLFNQGGLIFLEYIESTGEQYIDTGHKLQANTHIVTDLIMDRTNVPSGGGTFMTGWYGVSPRLSYAYVDTSNKVFMYYNSTYTSYSNDNTKTGVRHSTRYFFDGSTSYLYINESTVGKRFHDSVPNYNLIDYPIYLFASCKVDTDTKIATPNLTYKISAKLYGAKIYVGGANTLKNLEADFVPAKLGSAVGLYEKITGEFFPSATGVNFIAGPSVEEIEIPLTTSNWEIKPSNTTNPSVSIDDNAKKVLYSINSSGSTKSEYVYSKEAMDLTQYSKCFIDITINSLETTKTSGTAAYVGLALAACANNPPTYETLIYSRPMDRVSYDWGNRSMLGLYRDSYVSYPQLTPGDYAFEFNLKDFSTLSGNRYLVLHLSTYYYNANYTINSIKFI